MTFHLVENFGLSHHLMELDSALCHIIANCAQRLIKHHPIYMKLHEKSSTCHKIQIWSIP